MQISSSIALAVTALFGSPSVTPAVPEGTSSLQVDRSRLHYALDHEGAHWVRGRTYKASVDGGGFTYVPFLGSDSPRNFPAVLAPRHGPRGGDFQLHVSHLARVPLTRLGERPD